MIDTIGMNDKTPVDIFGTPHTDALHVVERYRLIDDGKQLEVVFTVEDARAFTTPWTGRMVYGLFECAGVDRRSLRRKQLGCRDEGDVPDPNRDEAGLLASTALA